jgi:eukaryotic-like serine/threonine-protein kinase
MLSAARMVQMSRLLDEALELEPEDQLRWLEALSPEYQDLLPGLRRALLPQQAQATGADQLATLPKISDAGGQPEPGGGPQQGDRIGPYLLVRQLGSGGMATVWLASRADGAFKREVALKLPLISPRADLAGRFVQERDILAGLEHPNIARLYDAGVSAEGLAYLAMECVQGKPLTDWCDAHRLGIDGRLKLFLQVLDAVQYAHGHQVIHRDIKPSNILVTDEGQVRLLDFGVAKLLGDEADQTGLTRQYGRALTPQYASPEVIRGDPIGAATDVYSLGVVLYELLAGTRPYRLRTAASAMLLEQAVATAQVKPPSTQVGAEAGGARGATQHTLARRLRGDLDTIVLKALAKDAADRYGSVTTLADDLLRHLKGEPISARPDHLAYRLTRYGRRHRIGVAAAATAAVLITAAVGYALTRPFPPSQDAATKAATVAPGTTTASLDDKSIAVLPFVDMSEKHDQEYFSDGLSDELIERLSRSPELKVIARTSSFQFKGRNEDMRTIGNKLGVTHLLEGSVRKSGAALRITVQLIRASDGSHRWSQSYDRNVGDIFQLQADIASAVAATLKVALTEGARGGPARESNTDAYNLLLQGDYVLNRGTRIDTSKAIAFFNEAVKLDPAYALGWARLARANFAQAANGWTRIAAGSARGRDAAQRAIGLDRNLAYAHRVLGDIYKSFDWNWAGAQSEYARAIELDPTDLHARASLAELRETMLGHLDEAIDYRRRLLLLDPLDTNAFFELSAMLYFAERYEESVAIANKLQALDHNFAGNYEGIGLGLLFMGRTEEALAACEKEPDEAWRLSALPIVHWALGHRAESDAALRQLETSHADGRAYQIAEVHAYRGEVDAAFDWLGRASRQRDGGLPYLKVSPLLRHLHGDPRWHALLARMQFVD